MPYTQISSGHKKRNQSLRNFRDKGKNNSILYQEADFYSLQRTRITKKKQKQKQMAASTEHELN